MGFQIFNKILYIPKDKNAYMLKRQVSFNSFISTKLRIIYLFFSAFRVKNQLIEKHVKFYQETR